MAKPNPLKSIASEVAQSLDKPTERPPASPAYPAPAPPPDPDVQKMLAEARAEVPSTLRKPTGSKTSREGKRFLGVYVEPRRHEEIKQAALDEGLQVQELVQQAIDQWMGQYGQEAVEAVAARYARRSKRIS